MEHVFFDNDEEAIEQHIASGNTRLFRPQKGKNIVRILPTWKAPDQPGPRFFWLEYWEHYFKVDGKDYYVPSPRFWGETDPKWNKADEYFASGDPEKAELAREFLLPSRRFYFNVVVLKHPPMERPPEIGRVYVMKAGKTVWDEIVKIHSDKSTEFHSITKVDAGINIKIERTGDRKGTRYSTGVAGSRSNLLEDLKALGVETTLDELASQLTDLEAFLAQSKMSGDQIEDLMNRSGMLTGQVQEFSSGTQDPFEDFKSMPETELDLPAPPPAPAE